MPNKAEDIDGKRDITAEELALARQKEHPKDITSEYNRFLDIFKKALGKKKRKKGEIKERVNWYMFKDVNDGIMIKYEVEGFIDGRSAGTRHLKFYVTKEKAKEIKKFVDDFPRKSYQDPRTHKGKYRPFERKPKINPEDLLLNLDDIWELDKMKSESEKREKEANKDIWTA